MAEYVKVSDAVKAALVGSGKIAVFLSLIKQSDVVEVVRCKDCIYNANGCCTRSEAYDDTRYRPDYFCADGDPREDGDG